MTTKNTELESKDTSRRAHSMTCVVTSDKMQKSRVGKVERLVKDPRYKKYLRRTTKIMFHDEENTSRCGDKVLIAASKPKSARKRFSLVQIISKA